MGLIIALCLIFVTILLVWYLLFMHFKKRLLAKQAREKAAQNQKGNG